MNWQDAPGAAVQAAYDLALDLRLDLLESDVEKLIEAAAPHVVAAWLRSKKADYPGKDFGSVSARYRLESEAEIIEKEAGK